MSKSSPNSDSREALADQRRRLKVKLWVQGGGQKYPPAGVFCAYCGEVIDLPNLAVMHEWLIKRNAVPLDLQVEIMHEYNCVLVHYDCHEQFGQWREFKLACARAQYKRYGRDTIVAWAESLGLRQHVGVPTEEETC